MGRRNLSLASREEGVILHVNLKPEFPRAGDKVKGKQEKWEEIHLGKRECNLNCLTDVGSPGVVVRFWMPVFLSFPPLFY